MNTSHLLILMNEAKLSPEALAKRLGISNMSVRRWMNGPRMKPLPEIYQKSFEDAVYQLMIEGVLGAETRSALLVLERSQTLPFRAAMKNLGLSGDMKASNQGQTDQFMVGISQIGSNRSHQNEVDASKKKINSFKKMGNDWSKRISVMTTALRSDEISGVDKLVAYGALFYLICPFDLIPDSIPVFGLVDDYAVLGLAMGYYLKKYSELFA